MRSILDWIRFLDPCWIMLNQVWSKWLEIPSQMVQICSRISAQSKSKKNSNWDVLLQHSLNLTFSQKFYNTLSITNISDVTSLQPSSSCLGSLIAHRKDGNNLLSNVSLKFLWRRFNSNIRYGESSFVRRWASECAFRSCAIRIRSSWKTFLKWTVLANQLGFVVKS